MTELLEKERIEYDSRHSRSSLQQRSRTRGDVVIPHREVYKNVEVILQETINILDDQVVHFAERKVVDALETCIMDHNKAFMKRALRSTFKSILM